MCLLTNLISPNTLLSYLYSDRIWYGMEPTTLRLPSDLREKLEQEADERDFRSLSAYVRWLLERRFEYDPNMLSEPSEYDRIRSALEAHEERITTLEEALETSDTYRFPDEFVAYAEQVDWSDVSIAHTEARVHALAAALELLQERGDVAPVDLRERVKEVLEERGDEISDSSIQRMVSDALGQLDVVESEGGGHRYRWV